MHNVNTVLFPPVNKYIAFKYLGTMVNTNNSIEEEIKERIAAGNRAYHVHSHPN
jgi:hypothetical protein